MFGLDSSVDCAKVVDESGGDNSAAGVKRSLVHQSLVEAAFENGG
jgi:hypothetical protein